MSRMPRHLMQHAAEVAIVRLAAGTKPDFDWQSGPLASLTQTADETSVICAVDAVPEGATSEGPFTAIEVAGPLAFEEVGVFVELLDPLREAGISVLGLSTFDTDWILVPSARIDDAAAAWRRAGIILTPTTLHGGSS